MNKLFMRDGMSTIKDMHHIAKYFMSIEFMDEFKHFISWTVISATYDLKVEHVLKFREYLIYDYVISYNSRISDDVKASLISDVY